MKKILVLVAQGSEEIEVVAIVDILRRATWDVTLASIHDGTTIECSRQIRLIADCTLASLNDPMAYDAMILPGGGPGTQAFRASTLVLALCQKYVAAHKWLGAICAAPLVLQDAGLLKGIKATCHPGRTTEFKPGTQLDDAVVVDGRIVTSRGPGTTMEFALRFVELLGSKDEAHRLRQALVLP